MRGGMEDIGKIVEERGKTALVAVEKKAGPGCSGCGLCRAGKDGGNYLEAENVIGAKAGEKVKVYVPEKALFTATCFLYGLPVLGFILGVFLGSLVSNTVVRIFIYLLFFGGSWFWGLNLAEKTGCKNQPKIVEKM